MKSKYMRNGNGGAGAATIDETAKLRGKYKTVRARVEYIMKQYPQHANDYNLIFMMYKIMFENAQTKTSVNLSEGKDFFQNMLDLMSSGATFTAIERARRLAVQYNPRLVRKAR